ncbi:MAG: DUF2924 domain-containing protein [Planctomycetes bacterium]|nr:DUF2924 domain-containing protein [Planctomycetota bacterium]
MNEVTSPSPPTIAAEIERLRHLPVIDLLAEYERLFGKPPRCKHRDELRKKWRDTEIVARVTSDGIDCGGVLYKTLTACVRNVTGSDWNPKIFFGVTPRRKRS